jgi:alpha-N-acetylglucosamine transferase
MKKAFVTFLQTADHLPGVLALDKSLRFFGNNEDLIVMTTRSLPVAVITALEDARCKIRFVEPIGNPHLKTAKEFNFYTKLRIFELVEFEKVIYLDADLIICADIGPLFFRPNMSAVIAGGLSAGNDWTDLNAGLMVIQPSLELFDRINAAVDHLPSKDGSDQGFLQSFYPDWPHTPHLHLDHAYNVPAPCLDIYCKQFGYEFSYNEQVLTTDIAVLHYWGPAKPWQVSPNADMPREMPKLRQAIELWWDFYAATPVETNDPLV